MNDQIGTRLPVRTTADLFPVIVGGMGGLPRLREGSKPTPDGEQTYATNVTLMMDRDGVLTPQKSSSVHVIEAAPEGYQFGQMYRAEGRVFVQPYESNSRVALSITVERLVPVQAAKGASRDA